MSREVIDDEARVAQRLAKSGLTTLRFAKKLIGKKRTPDFQVTRHPSDEVLFYCEVKSIKKDEWLDRQLAAASPGEIVGGLRNDPVYNRLSVDIHDAIGQFDSVNHDVSRPNVLAFVNHDRKCGFQDLISVLTGYVMLRGGEALPIFGKFSEGRIREEKRRLHLCLWLDDFEDERLWFSLTNEDHHLLLCRCFGVDPASIKLLKFPSLR